MSFVIIATYTSALPTVMQLHRMVYGVINEYTLRGLQSPMLLSLLPLFSRYYIYSKQVVRHIRIVSPRGNKLELVSAKIARVWFIIIIPILYISAGSIKVVCLRMHSFSLCFASQRIVISTQKKRKKSRGRAAPVGSIFIPRFRVCMVIFFTLFWELCNLHSAAVLLILYSPHSVEVSSMIDNTRDNTLSCGFGYFCRCSYSKEEQEEGLILTVVEIESIEWRELIFPNGKEKKRKKKV